MIEPYDWAGGREIMLRFGPANGPVVIAALPLFEEANRTRTFVVAVLRLLARDGIAGVLPDLPGMGDSLIPSERITMAGLHAGFAAAARTAGPRAYSFAIRSGALLDGSVLVRRRWHFAPQTGAELLRTLNRVRRMGGGADYAGHRLPQSFLDDLPEYAPEPARTLRLEGDPRPADRHVPGAPLWHRAEPDHDPALAMLLAEDIAAWVRQCEA